MLESRLLEADFIIWHLGRGEISIKEEEDIFWRHRTTLDVPILTAWPSTVSTWGSEVKSLLLIRQTLQEDYDTRFQNQKHFVSSIFGYQVLGYAWRVLFDRWKGNNSFQHRWMDWIEQGCPTDVKYRHRPLILYHTCNQVPLYRNLSIAILV